MTFYRLHKWAEFFKTKES